MTITFPIITFPGQSLAVSSLRWRSVAAWTRSATTLCFLTPSVTAVHLGSQAETIAEANQYDALSNVPCSNYMKQFVYAVLFPKCDIIADPDTQVW